MFDKSETFVVSPAVQKTYTPFTELSVGTKVGQTPIEKCSAILPNSLQCWRAADVVVTRVETLQGLPGGMEEAAKHPKITKYQLCRRHALIEQEQDALAAREDESTTQAAEVAEQKTVAEQPAVQEQTEQPARQ